MPCRVLYVFCSGSVVVDEDNLDFINERHSAIIKLEKSMKEMAELYELTLSLVTKQDYIIECISRDVNNALNNALNDVSESKKNIVQADRLQNTYRRKGVHICICLFVILVVIVIVVVVVIAAVYGSGVL